MPVGSRFSMYAPGLDALPPQFVEVELPRRQVAQARRRGRRGAATAWGRRDDLVALEHAHARLAGHALVLRASRAGATWPSDT